MMNHIKRAGLVIRNRWSSSLKSYSGLCSLVEHKPTRWEFDLGRGFSSKSTERTALSDFAKRVNHLSSFCFVPLCDILLFVLAVVDEYSIKLIWYN